MIKRYELDEKDIKIAIEAYMRNAHAVDPSSVRICAQETLVGYHEEKSIVVTAVVEVRT